MVDNETNDPCNSGLTTKQTTMNMNNDNNRDLCKDSFVLILEKLSGLYIPPITGVLHR